MVELVDTIVRGTIGHKKPLGVRVSLSASCQRGATNKVVALDLGSKCWRFESSRWYILEDNMTKRMVGILSKKIKYYPELCHEWGGYLTYVEVRKMKKAGFPFIEPYSAEYWGNKSKKGENGSTWFYFTRDFNPSDLYRKLCKE
jgi:hypothetical protein